MFPTRQTLLQRLPPGAQPYCRFYFSVIGGYAALHPGPQVLAAKQQGCGGLDVLVRRIPTDLTKRGETPACACRLRHDERPPLAGSQIAGYELPAASPRRSRVMTVPDRQSVKPVNRQGGFLHFSDQTAQPIQIRQRLRPIRKQRDAGLARILAGGLRPTSGRPVAPTREKRPPAHVVSCC